jgi:hypothetical protein
MWVEENNPKIRSWVDHRLLQVDLMERRNRRPTHSSPRDATFLNPVLIEKKHPPPESCRTRVLN